MLYRDYDRTETLKEEIIEIRAKIKSAQKYFQETYDSNIYNNIKLNLDFCLKLILKKDLEGQKKFLTELFKVLYEVGYRLKMNYENVVYILAPMKNFREELVRELADYIREHAEEGLLD